MLFASYTKAYSEIQTIPMIEEEKNPNESSLNLELQAYRGDGERFGTPLSDVPSESESIHSSFSETSNWTKGRSRQRLRVPSSLKENNFISKAVVERKIKMR